MDTNDLNTVPFHKNKRTVIHNIVRIKGANVNNFV